MTTRWRAAGPARRLGKLIGPVARSVARFHYGGGWSIGRSRCFILLKRWLVGVRFGVYWLRVGWIDDLHPDAAPGWRIQLAKDVPLGATWVGSPLGRHPEERDDTAT